MFRNKTLLSHAKHFVFFTIVIAVIGYAPVVEAQSSGYPETWFLLRNDGPTSVVNVTREGGPDAMSKDLVLRLPNEDKIVPLQFPVPGHYKVHGHIKHNSGNKQLNESFFILLRDENGKVYYPLDSNTLPGPYRVVPDDSLDTTDLYWMYAGLYYIPSSNLTFTVEFHHYANIWDDYPQFINRQLFENGQNEESVRINAFGYDYVPSVNGAISIEATGGQSIEIGGQDYQVVAPGENYAYNIEVQNLALDVIKDAQLVAYLPDSVSASNFSVAPSAIDGQKVTWQISEIGPSESLTISLSAAANGDFRAGYTPLIKTAELLIPSDIDPSDNVADNTVLVFKEPWPPTPSADLAVSVYAKTDSFALVSGDTIKYVRPGETYDLTLIVENIDTEQADNVFLYNQSPPFVTIENYSTTPDAAPFGYTQWRIPSLAPGERLSIRASATVDTSLKKDKVWLTDVLMVFSENDANLTNNIAEAPVWNIIVKPPSDSVDLALSYTARTAKTTIIDGKVEQVIVPGESAGYSLIVRNNGPREVNNVRTWVDVPDSAVFANFNISPEFLAFDKHFWIIDKMTPSEEREITFTGTGVDELSDLPFPLPSMGGIYSSLDSTIDNNRDSTLVFVDNGPPNLVDISVAQRSITDSKVLFQGDSVKFVGSGKSYQIEITLTNNSANEATNVRLVDFFPDSVSVSNFSLAPATVNPDSAEWNFTTLQADDQRIITFTATVADTMPVGVNWLVNNIRAMADNEDANMTANNASVDSVLNRVEPPPKLVDISAIQESVTDSKVFVNGDSVNFAAAGASYRIDITLKNNSDYEAKNVRLIDLFPDSVTVSNFSLTPATVDADSATWTLASLPANADSLINLIATVSDSMPLGVNWLVNKVYASADNEIPGSQGDNAAVDSVLNRVEPLPPVLVDLSISQDNLSDSTLVVDGDTVSFAPGGATYKIAVTLKNNSAHEARNVRLFDLLPDSVSASQFSVVPKEAGRDTVEWTFPTLAAKAERRIEFDAFVSAAMPVGERWLVNRVFVNAENENLDSLANNTSADSVFNRVEGPVTKVVDVSVSQSALTDSAIVVNGDSVRLVSQINAYQVFLTAKNLGENEALGVRLVDQFPDSVRISDFSVDPETSSGDSASWTFTSLAPKEERSVSFLVTLPDSLPPGDHWYINRASVSAENESENHLQNNRSVDSVLYRVKPSPPGNVNLQVTQTALTDSTVMENGEELPYIRKGEVFKIYITVRNNSNAVAEDVVLSEKLADLGLLLGLEPAADEVYDDSLRWNIGRMESMQQLRFTLDVQLGDEVPPGRHTLNYRAAVSGTNEIETGKSDNVALLTVINETIQPPVTASIRSLPPAVDVGDSIHVDVRVDGPVASYDIWAYLADGEVDSTFADNFIAANALTPNEWLSVTRGFTIEHLRSNAREEPITFELRTVDFKDRFAGAKTTSMVVSSNYLVLDKNVYKSEQEDFLGIRFKLSYRREATLDIYDLNGRHITRVAQNIYDGGWTTYPWNGLTTDGQKVGSGVYLVTLRSGEFNAYKKFILVR